MTCARSLAFAATLVLCVGITFIGGPGVGCRRASHGSDVRFVATGSSTVAPLFNEVARRFESRRPGVRIDVQTGGSSRGLQDVLKGLAHIGMVSRALADEETDLIAHTIAYDGLCLIVNAANSVASLTDEQVRDVYLGRVRNWRELGGDDAAIVVVNKAEGRATLDLFLAHFGLQNSQIRADVVIGDNEQGVRTVAGNAAAVGYVSIGAAEYHEHARIPIRRLAAGDGTSATLANVANGSFPIRRPLNLVVDPRVVSDPTAGALLSDLIEFARSTAVHDLVEGLHLVPVEP